MSQAENDRCYDDGPSKKRMEQIYDDTSLESSSSTFQLSPPVSSAETTSTTQPSEDNHHLPTQSSTFQQIITLSSQICQTLMQRRGNLAPHRVQSPPHPHHISYSDSTTQSSFVEDSSGDSMRRSVEESSDFCVEPSGTRFRMGIGIQSDLLALQKSTIVAGELSEVLEDYLPVPPHMLIDFEPRGPQYARMPCQPVPSSLPWMTDSIHCLLGQVFWVSPQLVPLQFLSLLKASSIELNAERLMGSNTLHDGVIKVKIRRSFANFLAQPGRSKAAPPKVSSSSLRKRIPLTRSSSQLETTSFVGSYALKLRRSSSEYNRIYHEAVILDHLQTCGCSSSPRWLLYGFVFLKPTNIFRALLTDSVGKSFYDSLVAPYIDHLDQLDQVVPQWWQMMSDAVQELHQHGVIHADLKPAHFIIVDAEDGQETSSNLLRIIDFGASHIVPTGESRAPVRLVTADWASKEQLLRNVASFDSDLVSTFFSLTSMLIKLFIGCVYLPQNHQFQCASHIIELTPPKARAALHDLCKQLRPRGLVYNL